MAKVDWKMLDAVEVVESLTPGLPKSGGAGVKLSGPVPEWPPFDYGGALQSRWPQHLDLRTLAQRSPRPPRFIVNDWLPCGYATLLAGHGGIGKSGIALHLAVCAAMGHHFFGAAVEQRRALYLSCEDREDILHWRLKHICDYEGINIANLAGNLEVIDLVGHDAILYSRDPSTVETRTAAYEELATIMRVRDIEVLFVDGVSDAFAGNENAKTEVKQFVNSLLALIPAETGAVVLIGHVAKPTASAPNTSEGYSGTTGWHNAARARWYLYPETEQGSDYGGGRLTRTGRIQLELQKSNYGAADQGMGFVWDKRARLFVGEQVQSSADPAQRIAQEAADKQAILDAGRAASAKGITVPAASSGQKTAFNVLSAEALFPQSLKSPGARMRFRRLLREMLSEQTIKIEQHKTASRHLQQKLVFP